MVTFPHLRIHLVLYSTKLFLRIWNHLRIANLLPIVAVIFMSGCTSSLVYSPSMQLPVQPLQKKQGQIGFGIAQLPETRPAAVGQKTSLGAEGFLRYGFSNKFSIQTRYWQNLDSDKDIRGGSLAATYLFSDTNNSVRFGLTFAGAILYGNGLLEGKGVAIIGSMWLPELSSSLKPNCSFGTIFGYTSRPKEWGAGLLLQAGLAWSLSQVWTLHFEGSFITQMNFYDDITHGIPSLSVATSITF